MSVVRLMRAAQILPLGWFVYACDQTVAVGEDHPGLGLEAFEYGVLRYDTLGNLSVAVAARVLIKDAMWCEYVPKVDVADRPQPFHHVLNVFKDHHVTSVPKPTSRTQIWEVRI